MLESCEKKCQRWNTLEANVEEPDQAAGEKNFTENSAAGGVSQKEAWKEVQNPGLQERVQGVCTETFSWKFGFILK